MGIIKIYSDFGIYPKTLNFFYCFLSIFRPVPPFSKSIVNDKKLILLFKLFLEVIFKNKSDDPNGLDSMWNCQYLIFFSKYFVFSSCPVTKITKLEAPEGSLYNVF